MSPTVDAQIGRGATTPSLDLLGRELLAVPMWRRVVSLTAPFLVAIGFFLGAATGIWIGSMFCAMLLTFLTYGSISHDLVHRTLHLEHFYPQVPHHNWPELARRIDPHFARAGLRPLRLFF